MTTATPTSPVTYSNVIGGSDRFLTPQGIGEYAQSLLNPAFATAAPGMRPRVEVFPHAAGIGVRVSVTGEGFTGEKQEVRVYPARRLMDEDQIKSAIWLHVSSLLNQLKPIPTTDESGE